MLIDLEPSREQMRIAEQKNLLKTCPFCSGHPICYTQQNTSTGFYVSTISCLGTNRKVCHLIFSCCRVTREDAENEIIERWENRI